MPRTQAHPKSAPNASIDSFESNFERLTSIVDRLEAGNVALADMLALYEEGMALSATLKTVLDQAELKVEKLAGVHEEVAQVGRPEVSSQDSDDSDLLF